MVKARLILPGVLLAILSGCAGREERGQVSGSLRSNGLGLGEVRVTFVPQWNQGHAAVRAQALTDKQGQFELESEDGSEGVIAGPYIVIVEDMSVYSAPRSQDGTLLKKPAPRFPSKYKDMLQTPIHKEVKPGPQQIEIDISS
jgi:hypothetical protein